MSETIRMNTLLQGRINGIADNHLHLNACKTPNLVVTTFIQAGGKYLLEVITHPKEADISLTLHKQSPEVVHIAFGIYPGYLKPKTSLPSEEVPLWIPTPTTAIELFNNFINNYNSTIEVIGEIGFDIYGIKGHSTRAKILKQQEILLAHMIQYAIQYNKPIMFHLRGADNSDFSVYQRALQILKEFRINTIDDHKVYFHSFTVTDHQIAKHIADTGFLIGLNGIVTYRSASAVLDVLPLFKWDQILFETDSPFLTPKDGKQINNQNTPLNTPIIMEFVSAHY